MFKICEFETCLLNTKSCYDPKFQVGIAWAMTRTYYNSTGFYDYCIIGNSDLLSAVHFTDKTIEDQSPHVLRLHTKQYSTYRKTPKPKSVSYCNMVIKHLHHGNLKNRKYWERNRLFDELSGEIHDLITTNKDGVFEWKTAEDREKWNKVMFEYFSQRGDDDVSNESVSLTLEINKGAMKLHM
jgi:hypothetical protein